MRAILGSYDSELTPAEYAPQLTRRLREAEDMVQKVHAHSSEVEVSVSCRLAAVAAAARTAVLTWKSRSRGTSAASYIQCVGGAFVSTCSLPMKQQREAVAWKAAREPPCPELFPRGSSCWHRVCQAVHDEADRRSW